MERCAVRVGMVSSSKAHVGVRSAAAALSAGLPADGDLCILGLVLAAGIRLLLPGDRAISIRIRRRPATVLVEARQLQTQFPSISDRLQYKSLPLVQAGVVLFPVHDAGPRLCGKRATPLEQAGTGDAHLQSLIVLADGVFVGPHLDGENGYHVGKGNCHHPVLSAAHVPVYISDWAAGAVPLRRYDNDYAR